MLSSHTLATKTKYHTIPNVQTHYTQAQTHTAGASTHDDRYRRAIAQRPRETHQAETAARERVDQGGGGSALRGVGGWRRDWRGAGVQPQEVVGVVGGGGGSLPKRGWEGGRPESAVGHVKAQIHRML